MDGFDPEQATAQWLATLSPEATARAIDYTQGGHWLILWGALVGLLVSWIIIRLGLLTAIRDRLQGTRKRPVLVSLVVGLVYFALSWALTLPWSIYASWYRETQFGLTSQPLAGWMSEAALSAAISAVLSGVLLMGLYALIRRAGRLWWAWGAGLAALALVFVQVIAPIAIEPLFNNYTTAPDGPVRDAVVALADKTGTPSDKIYIYDGSRQSDRYTANVSGMFGSARVAMSDVMFAKGADIAEVRAVVAHEMGHYVHTHTLWLLGGLVAMAAIGFFIVDRTFTPMQRLLGAARVEGLADPAGLPVLAAVLTILGVLATPLNSSLTRLVEEDADRFSLQQANEPDGLARALIKTAEYRAPSPGKLEEMIFYSHPSVETRIRRAMEWKAAHPPAQP
jgi:STE24 endopeptidase